MLAAARDHALDFGKQPSLVIWVANNDVRDPVTALSTRGQPIIVRWMVAGGGSLTKFIIHPGDGAYEHRQTS